MKRHFNKRCNNSECDIVYGTSDPAENCPACENAGEIEEYFDHPINEGANER